MKLSRAKVCAAWALMAVVVTGGVASAQDEKPKLDPKNAVWAVKLSDVYSGKPATLYLATNDGKVLRAFSLGEFNKALHDVDGSALAVSEAGLKGAVKVTVNADQWIPPGGKPIECQFELDIAVKEANLGGTYKGKRGGEDVSGIAMGTLQAPAKAVKGTLMLDCERALDGPPNFQRVSLTIAVADGKVGQVQAKPKSAEWWKARVKETKLNVTPEAVTGDLAIEVYEARDATTGVYTFTFDGKVIGDKVAGKFKSKLGDKEIRDAAMFTGNIK